MMSKKTRLSKKSLAKLKSILLLTFLISYSFFLVKTNSQSNENANNLGFVFLIFSIIVIVLTILVMTKNPLADFIIKKYKLIVIALIALFFLIYFIPQIPMKSITGLFVIKPTTTTTIVKEEVSPGLVQTFSEMQAGKINIMRISGEGISLTELNLEVYNNLKNVNIVVSKLVSKPTSTMQDPPGNLYQYLKIEKTNIKDEDLKKVVIKFKVAKSWINENKIDESTISLNRYENNVWVGLSTIKTSEDNEYSYYETYTTGLSLFSITGSNQQQGFTTTTTIVTTTTGILGLTTTQSITTTLPLSIQFNRKLDCDKCGQHKAPPLTEVKMTITATVSKPIQNTRLIDYYPSEWTVTDTNGGTTSVFNSTYKKIQWNIDSVSGSVSRWYFIKSPQRTLPSTKYYFFSEMESQQNNVWNVIVADPTKDLVQPYNCSDANNNCAETTVTVAYPDGSKMMINYQKPVNYFNDSINQWQAVNSTLGTTSCTINYNYCVVKGVYEAHFKNDPTLAETVRYFYNTSRGGVTPHKNGYVVYQPFSLNYRNDLDQVQQINITKAVTGLPEDNKFTYPDIFGSGYNVSYEYLTDGIKEKLILLNKNILPMPEQYIINGGNPTLDMDFLIDYTGTLGIYVDGVLWDKKSTVTTNNRVDFKDLTTGTVLFYLPKPYAQDLNETNVSQQSLKYQFKKTGNKLYTVIKTPYSWLNDSTRVYPITIDPTTKIEYNKTVDYYSINNTLNEYFFNATNAEQRTYDFKNYWTKNDVCLGLYFGNKWNEFCGIDFDWVWYNSTNFTTYMNLTGTADVNYAGYKVNVKFENYLESDYTEMKSFITISNTGNKDISNSYLRVNVHDIRVNSTYQNNTFRVNTTDFWDPWAGWQEWNLSNTSLNIFYNQSSLVSRKFAIFNNFTGSWEDFEWNNSYWKNGIKNDLNYNLTVNYQNENNAPINLLLLTGALNNNDIINTNFKWTNAIKQNFTKANETYNKLIDWIDNVRDEAYLNGKEFYGQDGNISIEMRPNGIIHVEYNYRAFNDNISALYNFYTIASRFECFTYPKPNGFDTLKCPVDNTKDISYDFAKKELKLYERNVIAFYSLPYLLVDNTTGDLTKYEVNTTPSENNTFKISRLKLPSVFDIKKYDASLNFDVNFSYTGTSHCIKFPILRYANSTINVTMLNTVANYSFGRKEFIIENYTQGNSAIARIRVYPCCNIPGISLQSAEVCS